MTIEQLRTTTQFVFFGVFLTLSILIYAIHTFDARITALEHICHGQCMYGDHECKLRCDKLGHCPMASKEDE